MAVKKAASSNGLLSKFEYDFSLWFCEMDEEVALHISEILHEHGHKGFIEHQDQVGGRLMITEITNIIQQSKVTIIILSQNSLKSSWCRRVSEWNLQQYIEKGSKVLPVYVDIETVQIPLTLRFLNGLNYSSNFFKKRLLDCLKPKLISFCKSALHK